MMALVAFLLLHGAPLTAGDLVYSESRLLLENRVVGRELEIKWACYATHDTVEIVAARYEKDTRLAPGTWRQQTRERGFQSKADPELHVAIFPAEDLPRHSPCQAKLEDGEQTVLQVSHGLRRHFTEQTDAAGK